RIEGRAEDVLLALEHHTVERDVVGTARGLEAARPRRRDGVLLGREGRRDRRAEKLAEIELAAALLLPVVGRELVAARGEHRLHLVRRQLRVALQEVGDDAGGEGRRLRGAAAAEVAVA